MVQSTEEERTRGPSAERDEADEEEEGKEEEREDGCWDRPVMSPLWPSH